MEYRADFNLALVTAPRLHSSTELDWATAGGQDNDQFFADRPKQQSR
jgi:hypothetical protein